MCPLGDQETDQVCRDIKRWIERYDVPSKIHSDNGPCFTSLDFQNFVSTYGIEHSYSPTYRPEVSGNVERLNRTVVTMFTKLVLKNPTDWPDYLPDVQLAYN